MNKNLLKKTAFLTLFFCTCITGFAQNFSKKITVKEQVLTVIEICNLLKTEYNLKIAYSNNDEQIQRKIIVKAGLYGLEDFLNATLRASRINYQLTEQQLIIIPVKKINADKNPVTISGFVEDDETGEKLPGANIYIPGVQKGTTTNNYGFFSITLSEGIEEILVSYTGYETYQSLTKIDTDVRVNVKLKSVGKLKEVVVASSRTIPIHEQTQMSKINVPVSIIKNMPHFLGEADLLKTLQLLPGVSQGMEGTSGIFVRGGTPDQNLMLLDGTPVYNPSHVFGVFSAFNTNALKSVDIYKGGFPARFGSRLSSVVDIVTKDGNMKEIHGEGAIGLLASNLTLEGPLKKEKTSFLVSGRRTYIDLIAAPIAKSADESLEKVGVYFYDLNVKLHHIVSSKDRLFLSLYSGKDLLKFKVNDVGSTYSYIEKFAGGWGNTVGTVRWNHVFNKKLFANTLVNYTRYRLLSGYSSQINQNGDEDLLDINYFSGIYDIGSRIDFDYRPIPEHSIKFGASILQHTFTPGVLGVKSGNSQVLDIDSTFNKSSQKSSEFAIYAEDEWKIFPKLKANIGFHASAFKANTKFYNSLQPRAAVKYLLPQDIALKVSYTHMNQYIHLLANNGIALPTDLWVPSTDKIKPMLSRQFAIGLAKSVWNNKVDISIECYYKKMDGIIEYKEGANYLNSSTAVWDSKVEAGKGTARGIELLIQKSIGKTKGWIGYTLSHSDRVFSIINYGKPFDYKYDRRHDFELVVTHTFNSRWEISGSWQFQTGIPFTIPIAQYEGIGEGTPYSTDIGAEPVNYTKGRNEFRLLNYHRLDIGVTWRKKKKRYEKSWNFGLYNAYNKQNPFYYYLDEYNDNKTAEVIGLTLLPILPTITYGIKF